MFSSSISNAKDYLRDEIYGDNIDLILMDYDLGAGGKGDDGLVEIRSIFPYKDIIFYSSQAGDLLELVAKKRLQGIYCSTRDELPDTVDGVFEALIKKVLDLDHSRGIVMGASSDVDYRVYECLVRSFELGDDSRKQLAFDNIKKDMEKKFERLSDVSDKITKIQHISALNDKKFSGIYTAADKLFLLQDCYKQMRLIKNSLEKLKVTSKRQFLNETNWLIRKSSMVMDLVGSLLMIKAPNCKSET